MLTFWVFTMAVCGFTQAHPARQDPIATHLFATTPGAPLTLHLNEAVWIDSSATCDITHLLLDSARFRPIADSGLVKKGSIAWVRFRLINEGNRAVQAYVKPFVCADTISIYYVQHGQIIDRYQTGMAFPAKRQSLPLLGNLYPVYVGINDTLLVYMKVPLCVNTYTRQVGRLQVLPSGPLMHTKMTLFIWQSLYMGIMVLICFVSFILFLLFAERLFIYYGLLMLFLGLYFPRMYGILDALGISLHTTYVSLEHLIISGIVLSTFLFISRYTRLKQMMSRYFWLYLLVSIAAFLFVHLLKLVGVPSSLASRYFNFVLLGWVILCFIPIIRYSLKPEPAARILLLSIVFMFLGSVVLILRLLDLLPHNPIIQHSFQFGVLAFSGILFYGLFDRIRDIQNERQRIKELDSLKTRFFANISHEFRTPLTLIMGPISQVMAQTHDPEHTHLLGMAKRNASRLLQLVNQLLDLSRITTGKMTLHIQQVNLASLLRTIVEQFDSLATSKGIRLKYVSQKDPLSLYVDTSKVEKVLYNLLANAFRYTPEGGEITVMVIDLGEEVEVLVRDTGQGMPADMLEHIFDQFSQGSKGDESQGSGIGLALVKELMELQGGSVEVESQVGNGTTFLVRFLKGTDHFEPQDLAPLTSPDEESNKAGGIPLGYALPAEQIQPAPSQTFEDEYEDSKPLLLLIEDSIDMRDFIRKHLCGCYDILEAPDGLTGIALAKKYLPDIIVSDVMMPDADGYEVCRTLKTDQHTSHIPFILLTAKAEISEKMEGLHTGADDYLIKPFEVQELEVRIHNLIEQRKALREKFLAEALGQSLDIDGAQADKAFLQQVTASINTHLTDSQFSVEVLAADVGFSRVHMNRKLKALTGLSANKFIVDYRLQLAMTLLHQGEHNVSEIGYQTGFGSTSYFVKCFREKFGTSPGTLLKK